MHFNSNEINRAHIHTTTYRYEIEYDENRIEIGYNIARRFLGIECERDSLNDSRSGADNGTVVVSNNGSGIGNVNNDEHKIGDSRNGNDDTITTTNATNTTTTTSTTTTTTSGSQQTANKENKSTNLGNDDVSRTNQTNDNSNETSKETNLNCEKDELVLDVLNDDLIAKVRGRILCKLENKITNTSMK